MTGTITLPQDLPAGTEIDVQIGLSLSITAMRPPVSPPPPPSFPAPVGYWKFDNNLDDSSGNGYTLTDPSATYGTGKFNEGYTGAGAQINAQTILDCNSASGPYTISYWTKVPNLEVLLASSNAAFVPAGMGNGLTVVANTVPSFPEFTAITAFDSDGINLNDFTFPGGDGDWHNVAFCADSGNVTLYVDGAAVANAPSVTSSTTLNNSLNFLVSNQDAIIDELAVWNVALTPTEIASIAAGTQTIAQLAGL